MAFTISRRLWRAGRPPDLTAGTSGSRSAHSPSRRSLGYGLRVGGAAADCSMPPVYHTDTPFKTVSYCLEQGAFVAGIAVKRLEELGNTLPRGDQGQHPLLQVLAVVA